MSSPLTEPAAHIGGAKSGAECRALSTGPSGLPHSSHTPSPAALWPRPSSCSQHDIHSSVMLLHHADQINCVRPRCEACGACTAPMRPGCGQAVPNVPALPIFSSPQTCGRPNLSFSWLQSVHRARRDFGVRRDRTGGGYIKLTQPFFANSKLFQSPAAAPYPPAGVVRRPQRAQRPEIITAGETPAPSAVQAAAHAGPRRPTQSTPPGASRLPLPLCATRRSP